MQYRCGVKFDQTPNNDYSFFYLWLPYYIFYSMSLQDVGEETKQLKKATITKRTQKRQIKEETILEQLDAETAPVPGRVHIGLYILVISITL